MTTPAEERQLWDACDPANLEFAVWAEDDYEAGIAHCLPRVLAAIENTPHGPLLDLGCGIGRLTIPVSLIDSRPVVGVDISTRMLEEARRDAAAARAPATFVRGDGRHLPRECAAGWSVLMFQHIPHTAQRGYLREIGSHLEPGGRFLLQAALGPSCQPLAYEHADESALIGWALDAGLEVTDIDTDSRYPWVWLTLWRPSA